MTPPQATTNNNKTNCCFVYIFVHAYMWNIHGISTLTNSVILNKSIKKVSPSCYLAIVLCGRIANGRRSSVSDDLNFE